MINYTAVIDILKSEHFADKTGLFERFTDFHHETLTNCSGTGASLFLKTLACFLDRSIDTREAFLGKEIAKSTVFEREINSHAVIYLDFSDFNADSYEEAREYIRRKMSDVYKQFYKYFEEDDNHQYNYQRSEAVLDIIERHPSDKVLECSLRDLMLQLRGYETFKKDCKLALLIDNLVLLETVAEAKGYSEEMKTFLKAYIVNDVYKYCDHKHLESFFRPYFSEMKTPLPFVAYKGCLGISRDFPGFDDSHNATQAHIISDYMKTVKRMEQVDLQDMYNNYIAKWNEDIEEEDEHRSFKRESVLSLVVILDSLDAILGKTSLSEESFLLSGDNRTWHILANSQCWNDVNERWKEKNLVWGM